jgi:hypothetical protein
MKENKTNFINLNGNVTYAFNLDIKILKKVSWSFLFAIVLLHPITTNFGDNYYQTRQTIEKQTTQIKKCLDTPSRRQKPSTTTRKKKKRRSTCGT